jgi:N12 class adenine-specific DNA methylase
MTRVRDHAQERADAAWLCGLTLEDFEPPSAPTPVAQVARAVAAVTLDLADARTSGEIGDEPSYETEADFAGAALAAWDGTVEATDYADRKVLWPLLDPSEYAPSTSVTKRIEDNISAIRLMQAMVQEKRTPTATELAQLLRYSGWGGVARVFSADGSKAQPLAELREQLKACVGEREYAALQSSVNTAFYTPPELVRSIWRMLQHLGFEGGRICEPAAGVGHFVANMPPEIARKSNITAVEVDPTSAAILETAFAPFGLQVQACSLETAKLPIGFFDLVVGNVPFGNFKSNDATKAPYAQWLIHNWFLAKSIEMVRPGGLVAVITTQGTLDSQTDAHRRWLSAHAELVAAFRLPTMAFEAHAKTEAVADILVFKRREIPDFAALAAWCQLGTADAELFAAGESVSVYSYSRQTGNSGQQRQTINRHFREHPASVLGKLKWTSTQHGEVARPVFDGSMEALCAQLDAQVDQLTADIYQAGSDATESVPTAPMARYANTEDARPGAFVVSRGRICVSEGDELLDVDGLYTGTARKRLLGMIEIRDAAIAVIEHQARSEDDGPLHGLQQRLNRAYDHFVGQLGALSTSANSRVLKGDPNWPLLLALEIYDEESETVTKADIFTKRTIGAPNIPSKVDTAKDAMLVSLSLFGRIELADMAKRTGLPVREVLDQLRAEGLAYRDPSHGRWVPADEYLSGHIREKIAQARAAGPQYAANVVALEAVLPADLGPKDVEARLGAPWIPCDVISQFARELVKDTRNEVNVDFDRSTATWSVKTQYSPEYVGDRTLQTMKWGTSNRCALTLIEAALNQQPPTITTTVDNRQVVDTQATFAAREKWQAIRDEFRMWVYRDDARRDRLLRIYNDLFNQLVPRKFDGTHLHLPGMSKVLTPAAHQKNAIWRILVSGNTLLAHAVGAGKSLEMIAAAMELKRLGKARKPCHAVPNHLLSQYVAEAVRLYPQARILMATKEDLHGDRRRAFVARIATGDWDSIVMTHSTFERLSLSPDVQRGFIDRMLEEARTMMSLTEDRGAKRSIKEIEKRMKDHEARITRLVEGGKADDLNAVWFEELGVDWVFLDEGHYYKNLGRLSKMPRIAGLPNVSSQRAFDAFMKTRLIMEARGGKEEGVVLATATPISNSIAEMHVMQLFLQPETLKRFGLYEFDAWSASFGEAVTGIELAPDGSGFRTVTRYSRFINLPELMSVFRMVADICTKQMLKLPVPAVMGGKPQVMVAKPSATLKSIVADLVKRADDIRNRRVRPEKDNMLAITNDGRRAAIDVRLVDPSLPADPDGKLALLARNVHRIWRDGAERKLTQLVFSDIGTPGAPGFSVYTEIHRMLIALGIPAGEIEFIQDHDSDAAKAKLFKRVRNGLTRVLLGSTAKMGTGTNVQRLLKAVHQCDAPWVPAAVEQRDGRAERQGNENEEIELWRYITEGSFDAYSWNLLDVKARFIEQVMTADRGLRSVEDISITAMTYAELKAVASGNPLVMEKATVDAKVQRLAMAYGEWEDSRWRMGHRKANLQQRVAWIDGNVGLVEQDAKLAENTSAATPVSASTALVGAAIAAAGESAEAIGLAFREAAKQRYQGEFAQVNGFGLSIFVPYLKAPAELVVRAPHSGLTVTVDRPNMNDVVGVGRTTLDTIRAIAQDPAKLRDEKTRKTSELASVEVLMEQEFEHRDELAQARARQAEIEAQLDLDKSTTGSQEMAAEPA